MSNNERQVGENAPERCVEEVGAQSFDGVICFGGEDWWYHNRGHFDMQIMRRFSRRVPVLYVNSIGMRTPRPSEGRMFLTRVGRKLRSLRRGLVRVDDGFAVLSPIVFPSRAGTVLTGRIMRRMIRTAARRRGIRRPLIWVACPTAAEVLDGLEPVALVYQRTDRYEHFTGVDEARIVACDRRLKASADLTVFCSRALHEAEAPDCAAACLIDHGVDFDRFASAARNGTPEPEDIAHLPRPRIGFVGGIDGHTFDAELFRCVATLLPTMHFVLVGSCSLPAGWCGAPNVTIIGQRPYEQVAGYMAACDVLIMPWRRSRWIEACNPVKLKEYLATGRPVVSTDFPELRRYDGLVRTARDAAGFAAALRAAVLEPGDAQRRRDCVRGESWSSRVEDVIGELAARGITPETRTAGVRLEFASPTKKPIDGAFELKIAADSRPGPPAPASLSSLDLAACILLAGGLRRPPLVEATGRSVLDLWLTAEHTVLDKWVQCIAGFTTGLPPAPIRIVHDGMLPPPWPGEHSREQILIEREPKICRGPAGILRDLCAGYGSDQHVLVVEAARYASVPLRPLLTSHVAGAADVTVAANADDAPAGLYVIRCGALDDVPSIGFVDLKEQWLRKAVASESNIRVHRLPECGTLPLRTREQFLDAARIANGVRQADPPSPGASPSGNKPQSLRVICAGALIGPGVTIADSIVMPGAVIGAGSIVARSLVCPGASVQEGTDIADAVVDTSACLSDAG